MRSRTFLPLAVVALVAAGCGADSPEVQQPRFGLVASGDQGAPQLLTYAYEPDSTLTYDIRFDTAMDVHSEFPGLGSSDLSMGMTMAGEMAYTVSPGPGDGTVEVTMTADLDQISVEHMTMDGFDMSDQLTASDLEEMQGSGAIPPITAVVDSRGEILELRYGDAVVPSDFLGGGSNFGDPTGMSMMGILGPEMPSEEVAVGAEWTTDTSQEVPGFGTVAASSHYWITGEETFNGREVLVIVSSTSVESLDIDLMKMMEEMAQMDDGSLAAMGMNPQDIAEMQSELFADIGMTMSMSYDDLTGTTYFDPVDGLAVWSAVNGDMTGSIEMSTPDGTGTMAFDMNMSIQVGLHEGNLPA